MGPKVIASPDTHASVHALVLSLSPTKPRGTFFDGELTDGVKIVRVVGFDKQQHTKLQDFHVKQAPVTLGNCQVQFNKVHHKLEVAVHSYTNIGPSDAKFTVCDMKTFRSEVIELAAVTNENEYDKVTVKAQVIKIADAATVGRNLTKQEVTIADASDAALLTICQNDVGKLQLGQFTNLIA